MRDSLNDSRANYRKAQLAAVAERRLKVSEMYRRGISQAEMSRRLNVSPGTISEDVHALLAQWQEHTMFNITARIVEELEKINKREADCWDALEKSRQPKRMSSASKTVDAAGGVTTTAGATQVERLEGDPSWMARLEKCTEHRLRILELITQSESNNKDKNKVNTVEDFVANLLERRKARLLAEKPETKLLHE